MVGVASKGCQSCPQKGLPRKSSDGAAALTLSLTALVLSLPRLTRSLAALVLSPTALYLRLSARLTQRPTSARSLHLSGLCKLQ